MPSRKVSVFIYQYPEDSNRTMSLRRFMELSEELLWSERFFSSNDLRDLLKVYKQKLIDSEPSINGGFYERYREEMKNK